MRGTQRRAPRCKGRYLSSALRGGRLLASRAAPAVAVPGHVQQVRCVAIPGPRGVRHRIRRGQPRNRAQPRTPAGQQRASCLGSQGTWVNYAP